jgi:hypothetical protein
MYTMYHAGAFDILSFDDSTNEAFDFIDLPRTPSCGDVILAHHGGKTEVFMLIDETLDTNIFKRMGAPWKPEPGEYVEEGYTIPEGCTLAILELNEHKGFQH